MSEPGTQEGKRWRRAVPPASEGRQGWGCAAVALGIALGCASAFVSGRHVSVAVLAVAALLVALLMIGSMFASVLRGLAVLRRVRSEWGPRGIRCLVVTSRSAAWEEHVRQHWLPRLAEVAVVLDRSEPGPWKGTLAGQVFLRFCGTSVNYSPAVVVFRGLRRPLVFRFFYAFQEVKQGRPRYLEEQERRMFEAVLDQATP